MLSTCGQRLFAAAGGIDQQPLTTEHRARQHRIHRSVIDHQDAGFGRLARPCHRQQDFQRLLVVQVDLAIAAAQLVDQAPRHDKARGRLMTDIEPDMTTQL